jgi:hypothetical protein
MEISVRRGAIIFVSVTVGSAFMNVGPKSGSILTPGRLILIVLWLVATYAILFRVDQKFVQFLRNL